MSSQSLNILIVDDAPAILKMTGMMLKRLGHRTLTAENGEIAMQMVQDKWIDDKFTFDVVLMDLQMPVMDGLEAMKRIRAMEEGVMNTSDIESFKVQFSKLPRQIIVGMSANSDHETSIEALACGADTFIAKPFTVETFLMTLDGLLNDG